MSPLPAVRVLEHSISANPCRSPTPPPLSYVADRKRWSFTALSRRTSSRASWATATSSPPSRPSPSTRSACGKRGRGTCAMLVLLWSRLLPMPVYWTLHFVYLGCHLSYRMSLVVCVCVCVCVCVFRINRFGVAIESRHSLPSSDGSTTTHRRIFQDGSSSLSSNEGMKDEFSVRFNKVGWGVCVGGLLPCSQTQNAHA